MMLDDVERSLISIKHRTSSTSSNISLSHAGVNNNIAFVWPRCSTLLNACMLTKLNLLVSVSMAIICCLYLFRALHCRVECSSYIMTNEQSFESLNGESLKTSDVSSKG